MKTYNGGDIIYNLRRLHCFVSLFSKITLIRYNFDGFSLFSNRNRVDVANYTLVMANINNSSNSNNPIYLKARMNTKKDILYVIYC